MWVFSTSYTLSTPFSKTGMTGLCRRSICLRRFKCLAASPAAYCMQPKMSWYSEVDSFSAPNLFKTHSNHGMGFPRQKMQHTQPLLNWDWLNVVDDSSPVLPLVHTLPWSPFCCVSSIPTRFPTSQRHYHIPRLFLLLWLLTACL